MNYFNQKSLKTVVLRAILLPPLAILAFQAFAVEFQGKVSAESLLFFQQPKHPEQKNEYFSATIEPEFYHAINDNQEINAKLFYRYDAQSTSRTHVDVRELMLNYYAEDWEFNLGIGKVFWGTTESRNLVDTINQVDWVESLDNEARLGQPMVQGKLIKDWGTLDLFVLPYFREMDFLGAEARPRINPVVAKDKVIYQSKSGKKQVDFALRWGQSYADLDIGLSTFHGTQRMPILTPKVSNGQVELVPVYVQTRQYGLDSQYILGDMLLKLELLARDSHQADFSKKQSFAGVAGLEYTLVGLFNSAIDLGLIAEYMYDDWQALTPFQNDWMTGLRLVLNDQQSSELLIGNIFDLDDGSQLWSLEASRRIGDNWKLELTGRWLTNVGNDNSWYQVYKQDDLVSLRGVYYF